MFAVIFSIASVIWISQLCGSVKIGDECKKDTVPGFCKYEEHCNDYLLALKESHAKRYDFVETKCGLIGQKLVVCCPSAPPEINTQQRPETTTKRPVIPEKRPSELACESFPSRPRKTMLDPLDLVDYIVNGKPAKRYEFPQFAALAYKTKPILDFNCGGVLISSKFVLTAAHCFTKERRVTFVRLGTTNLTVTSPYIQDVDVKNQTRHPQYRSLTKHADIGLLELAKNVEFTYFVWPACLHQGESMPGKLDIAGFGLTKEEIAGGSMSSVLMKAETNEITDEHCWQIYRKNKAEYILQKFPGGSISNLICANSTVSDTCQGDSGSGLYLVPHDYFRDKRVVYGITSAGVKCQTEVPALYSRVSSYLDWIENVVWP